MRIVLTSLVFWFVVVILLAPVLAFLGPSVEERLFPVLGEQTVTVERKGKVVTFTNVVEKLRDCRVEEITYSIGRVRGDIVDRAPIVVRNVTALGPDGTATYPVGRIRTGPFTAILPDLFPDPTSIEGLIVYDCHNGFLWHTNQVFGPIPVPPPAP